MQSQQPAQGAAVRSAKAVPAHALFEGQAANQSGQLCRKHLERDGENKREMQGELQPTRNLAASCVMDSITLNWLRVCGYGTVTVCGQLTVPGLRCTRACYRLSHITIWCVLWCKPRCMTYHTKLYKQVTRHDVAYRVCTLWYALWCGVHHVFFTALQGGTGLCSMYTQSLPPTHKLSEQSYLHSTLASILHFHKAVLHALGVCLPDHRLHRDACLLAEALKGLGGGTRGVKGSLCRRTTYLNQDIQMTQTVTSMERWRISTMSSRLGT